ncbi:hypothetical protein CPB85DRAFT_1440608 [Mucidula mucida]|nr:hypothetical protein CPB85DRAFT_1440608 [Mucidula mucida]
MAQLCDITIEPGCSLESFYFLEDELELDGTEYHMGMSRGDISNYSSITTTKLHRDMIQLIRSGSWALLPSLDTLRKIRDLFAYNNKTSTSTVARKLFTATLPQKEYEYEFLPVCSPAKLPIYVGKARHDYPYRNFPRVKTTIHPCFGPWPHLHI